jgi:4-hydroxy-3-methylbut-2-enyl diphosphate reductase
LIEASPVPASTLVVAAPLRVEARALRRGERGLCVVRTGFGPRRSRRAAQRLRASQARSVAVAGLCGGLDADLAPGDLVVASELRGAEREVLPLAARDLVEALEAAGLPARAGPIASVDHVVHGAEREGLRADGAIAVDMESAWLALGAGERPLAVLRVVLDAPGHELLRPRTLCNLRRALRRLRAAAPALASWASAQPREASPSADHRRPGAPESH